MMAEPTVAAVATPRDFGREHFTIADAIGLVAAAALGLALAIPVRTSLFGEAGGAPVGISGVGLSGGIARPALLGGTDLGSTATALAPGPPSGTRAGSGRPAGYGRQPVWPSWPMRSCPRRCPPAWHAPPGGHLEAPDQPGDEARLIAGPRRPGGLGHSMARRAFAPPTGWIDRLGFALGMIWVLLYLLNSWLLFRWPLEGREPRPCRSRRALRVV